MSGSNEYGKADPVLADNFASACATLEELRCLEAEREGCLVFASSLLEHHGQHHDGGGDAVVDASNLPGALQDAWAIVSEAGGGLNTKKREASSSSSLLEQSKEDPAEFTLGGGQMGKAVYGLSLAKSLHRAAELDTTLRTEPVVTKQKRLQQQTTTTTARGGGNNNNAAEYSSEALLAVFDDAYQKLRQYHARHSSSSSSSSSADKNNANNNANTTTYKRRKVGHPTADGYDLSSYLQEEFDKLVSTTATSSSELMFTQEEVLGKYLDLGFMVEDAVPFVLNKNKLHISDILVLLQQQGLGTGIPEEQKLKDRKKYSRVLAKLQTYLQHFLERTSPLIDATKEIIEPALQEFNDTWNNTNSWHGWKKLNDAASSGAAGGGVDDLQKYQSAEELLESVGGEHLKTALTKLGLKCGGTPLDRAKRLWMTKDTPLDKLPKKLFAKKKSGNNAGTKETATAVVAANGNSRRDLAQQEACVSALLDQLRPTLEATIRRAERRQTQTVKEKEKELEEELYGQDIAVPAPKKDGDDSESEEEEDAPIYNPKGVPLGWDGKPIPYWLYKLHGLSQFYPCEICGNESYRGRRDFEKHFAESKHAYGMKCLGIPNTQHFHGVTKIEDAQDLWKQLQSKLDGRFDGSRDEEYEDSHGNVLSRTTYEDLARQGLL